ncbi:unnamed protein product [Spirodela intermedia]|uniref:O-methyltransferase C-terminal domain-containing protein n=1 Tax=Spirodela intermedia TaxID=51605 RepID=A0A7I8K4X6_SPIIN|nr:unnamed protein product [Spirodela intermedia]
MVSIADEVGMTLLEEDRAGSGAQLFPEEIVAQLPTENQEAAVMVDRILRLLASYSILICSVVNDEVRKARRRYGPAVPFSRAHGMTLFEYLGTDPRFNKVFNASMNECVILTVSVNYF